MGSSAGAGRRDGSAAICATALVITCAVARLHLLRHRQAAVWGARAGFSLDLGVRRPTLGEPRATGTRRATCSPTRGSPITARSSEPQGAPARRPGRGASPRRPRQHPLASREVREQRTGERLADVVRLPVQLPAAAAEAARIHRPERVPGGRPRRRGRAPRRAQAPATARRGDGVRRLRGDGIRPPRAPRGLPADALPARARADLVHRRRAVQVRAHRLRRPGAAEEASRQARADRHSPSRARDSRSTSGSSASSTCGRRAPARMLRPAAGGAARPRSAGRSAVRSGRRG